VRSSVRVAFGRVHQHRIVEAYRSVERTASERQRTAGVAIVGTGYGAELVRASAGRWHGKVVTSRPVVDNGAGMLVRRVAAGIASALLFAVAVVPAQTHLVLPPRQPVP
jgi:hypothetical protein